MIILIGPSASGKTSIAKELIEKYNFKKFVTNTTRKMRVGEINDIDYHFITKEQFLDKLKNNMLIEYVEYNDNYYGTSMEDVTDDKVLIVDIKGANKFFEKIGSSAVFFYITCSDETLKKRMISRGDDEESIKERLKGDKEYFKLSNLKHYDYIINTDDKDNASVTEDVYNKYIQTIKG